MKILVVCQYYYPENFQITPICEQLVRDKHEVTVLTGLPNYPTGIVPEEYKKGRRDEVINGVHVIRCYEVGRKNGVFRLIINYISFCCSALRKVSKLQKDYDVVFTYLLSPITMALPGWKYAKKNKIPVFLYCCDLWPESSKIYIKSEKSLIYALLKKISKKVYMGSSKIGVQSNTFIPYLEEVHGIPTEKMVYLPAFADETYLTQNFNVENDTIDFVFLGNLGKAQNLIAVLKAIEKIKDVPNFKVHFVGEGSCLEDMKCFVQTHALGNIVQFYGRHPVEEMVKYYKLADACLVSLGADSKVGLTLPSKVQGYMAAGKPIIGMADGMIKIVIEEARCGICVPAGDIEGFSKALFQFISEKNKYQSCGENGRKYFRNHFSKAGYMKKLEKELEGLGRKTDVNI
ncbi:MAG: glycosyltransferase family 4 protein [Lachnospiraceae bacterium]|nr:glycosyltransferase family 4 protein [Lachnospiraceae bacterium]